MINKNQELEIFSRHLILKEFKEDSFKNLQKQNISIIGIGGIGCPAAQYLVSAGIKNLKLIDSDVVSLSNLNRQILFNTNDVGKYKSIVAKKKLLNINPNCKIKALKIKIKEKNIIEYLKNSSLIIDSTDNWETMILVNKFCVKNSIPLVSASVIGFDSQIALFLNNKKKHLCLQCIFPNKIEPDLARCDTVGVLGTAAGAAGLISAQKTINYFITKKNNEFMTMVDMKTLKINSFRLKKNRKCSILKENY